MSVNDNTLEFVPISDPRDEAEQILMSVYAALKDKGYDPIIQIVGYLISGDPTYITNHQGARSLICRLERDEILEELATFYLRAHEGEKP